MDGAFKRASVQAIADLVARGEIKPGQAPALFAVHCQHLFGLSVGEFLRRYDAGEYAAPGERCKVTSLELLMSVVRPTLASGSDEIPQRGMPVVGR